MASEGLNTLSSRLDRDQLSMVSRDKAADAAHTTLFPINALSAPEMTAGVAVLFAAVAERSGVHPEDLHNLGRRILFAEDFGNHKTNSSLEALRDFAALRIRNKSII